MAVRYKRRQYIVKRHMQYKYAAFILIIAGIAAVIAGYTVFFTGWTIFGTKLAELYPQGRLQPILVSVNIALFRNILIILPILFIFGIYFSHKIAGPLFRIEETLRVIGTGKLGFRVRLRKGDELKELETAVNDMIAGLEKIQAEEKKRVGSLLTELYQLFDQIHNLQQLPQDIRDKIDTLKDQVNNFVE